MTRFLPVLGLLGATVISGNAEAQERTERLTLGDGTTSVSDQNQGRDGVLIGNVCAVHSDLAAGFVVDVYLLRNDSR